MASLTQWTWVWVNSRSWWWTGRPGVLRFMESQRVRHNWATELNWLICQIFFSKGFKWVNSFRLVLAQTNSFPKYHKAKSHSVFPSLLICQSVFPYSESTTILEKAMAPHSSTFAQKIPWMEEPGRLQSMGSLRVRHDWATSLSLSTFMHWRRKWHLTPVVLPGESHGWRSLVGCSPWGRTESDMTEVT